MKPKLENKLEEYLDEDERLLWKRPPGREGLRAGLRVIQICGHLVLVICSILFALLLPLPLLHTVVLGFLLITATNAPLVIWALYRLPELSGSGDSLFFMTDRRVGLLRPDGEFRQAPICPGLHVNVNVRASLIEFSLGERTPVSFGGLKKEEILLVSSVAEGLIKKCE